MENKYLITIIVAIYNGQKYLTECIDSILNQNYSRLEIILVDDGSTDESGNICDKYLKKDKRIKVIHQKNGGVSVARNNALKISNGDYICFIDQDDYIENDYVSYLLNLIIENNTEISVVPNVIYASEKQKIYSEKHKSNFSEVWSGKKAACEMLNSKMEIGPWSKMISKKLIDDNKISYYVGIFGGEGYAFSVESFAASKKVAVGYKGIYNYRVDNYESEMSKFRPRAFKSSLTAVTKLQSKFKDDSDALKKATNYAYWRVYVAFLNSLVASNAQKRYPDEYKILVRNCKKYAYRSITADVPLKRKVKDLLYFISPVLVAKINNSKDKKRELVKEL